MNLGEFANGPLVATGSDCAARIVMTGPTGAHSDPWTTFRREYKRRERHEKPEVTKVSVETHESFPSACTAFHIRSMALVAEYPVIADGDFHTSSLVW